MQNNETPVLGAAHFCAIDCEPADLVTLAARAGFGAVGFRLFPAFAGAPFYSLPQGSAVARDVADRLASEGVVLNDIEFIVIDEDFQPEVLRSVIEDAAALGARRLSCCGQDGDRSRLTDNFAALCEIADLSSLAVDLENMGWRPVARIADAVAVVLGAARPNGGVLVDALHAFRNGATADQIAAAGPLVGHLQLCDVRGPEPQTDALRIAEARGGRFAPGEGDLPLAALLNAVPRNCTISVEVPLAEDADAALHLVRLHDAAMKLIRSKELSDDA